MGGRVVSRVLYVLGAVGVLFGAAYVWGLLTTAYAFGPVLTAVGGMGIGMFVALAAMALWLVVFK